MLIRHLWQLKTVVILHWCLIRGVQLPLYNDNCSNDLTYSSLITFVLMSATCFDLKKIVRSFAIIHPLSFDKFV